MTTHSADGASAPRGRDHDDGDMDDGVMDDAVATPHDRLADHAAGKNRESHQRPPDNASAPSTPADPNADLGLRFAQLLAGQKEIFDLSAKGLGIAQVLERLLLVIEEVLSPGLGSLQLQEVGGESPRGGVAPNLSVSFKLALQRLYDTCQPIPSSIAASQGQKVLVLADDRAEQWQSFLALAKDHGIGACWAQPILSSEGEVVGTLTLYYADAHAPTPDDQRIMDEVLALAAFVLQHEKSERSRQFANDRLASLAKTIPGVVYQRLVNPDGEICYTYISEGARELFGVSPEEILANPNALFDCHGPEYRATFHERLKKASRDLEMWDVEAQIITRDGQEKWTHAIARPHRLPDGSVLWDGVILDATRIKTAEFELRKAKEEAEAASVRQLIIENLSQGLALFGPKDEFVVCNARYLELYPDMKPQAVAGTSYEDFVRGEIQAQQTGEGVDVETLVSKRLSQHKQHQHSKDTVLLDGRRVMVEESRGSDGSTLVLHTLAGD